MHPIEFGQLVAILLVVFHDYKVQRTHLHTVKDCPMGLTDIVFKEARQVVVADHVHQDGVVGHFLVVGFVIVMAVARRQGSEGKHHQDAHHQQGERILGVIHYYICMVLFRR